MPITPSEEKWLAEVTKRMDKYSQLPADTVEEFEVIDELMSDIPRLLQLVARLKDENDTLHELIKPLQEAAQGRVKPLELVEADMKREERVQELVKAARRTAAEMDYGVIQHAEFDFRYPEFKGLAMVKARSGLLRTALANLENEQ